MSVSFFVPGAPVPQGRPRAYRLGNGVGMFDPPKSKAWKKVVAQVAGLQRNAWIDGPIEMSLVFFLPAPKELKRPDLMHHTKKPDIDNLVKGVCDGLNGVCFGDDSQICVLSATKRYAIDGVTGVEVLISPVTT